MKDKIFKANSVLGDKGYKHFGIHPCTCSLYGYKKEDIAAMNLKDDENQSLPDGTFVSEGAG